MNRVIVTADFGHLKVYRMVETPNRGPKLTLVDELNFVDAHGRYIDKMSDSAGQFPVAEGSGPSPAMATGEALTAELENQRRLAKAVAGSIEAILRREQPARWHFAAPAESGNAILEGIAPDLRQNLLWTVRADLTKTPPDEVLQHFV